MIDAFEFAVAAVNADPDVRAAIFTGAGSSPATSASVHPF